MNRLYSLLLMLILTALFFSFAIIGCDDDDDDDDDSSGDDDDDDNDDDDNDDDNDDNDDNDDDTGPGPSAEDCEPYNYSSTPQIIRGPYLQHVTQSSIRILWQTDTPSNSVIRFFDDKGNTYYQCDDAQTTRHEMELEYLSAETIYDYLVRSDGAESSRYHFSTAPNYNTPFMFTVYGDNRTQVLEHQAVAEGIAAESPDFVLNVGDIVTDGWKIGEYDSEFFDQMGELMTTTPVYISIGNHESESIFYYQYFSFPNNEQWYSFDYGNARYIALDSNWLYYPGTRQYNWFLDELKRAQADQVEWLFVMCHHPAYSEGWEGYDGTHAVRNVLVPLMEQYNVTAFFNGHTHDYERGELNGVYHVLTGGGGGGLDNFARDWPFVTVYESRHHYVKVQIAGKTAIFSAHDPDGTIFDTFTINH